MIRKTLLVLALGCLLTPWCAVFASTTINESRPADAQGTVEIYNVAGSIHVQGWDKAEVEVTGSIGKNVERVEVSGGGSHTSVRVVLRSEHGWNSEGEANLTVHVPTGSALSCNTVSADVKVSALRGEATLKTVSGDVDADVGGDVSAHAVSGTVHVKATAAKSIQIDTVSGDAEVTGGSGEFEVTTVSGDAKVKLATVGRARFQTVSGTLSASLGLGADARLEAQSVSGDVNLEFPSAPAADFDVQTFSGDIDNCFGPKPVEARHGSGATLTFKNGEGSARVRINTHSGTVKLCTK
jgi:DUF4097 and DUF4098 domain-containing protein YvlB